MSSEDVSLEEYEYIYNVNNSTSSTMSLSYGEVNIELDTMDSKSENMDTKDSSDQIEIVYQDSSYKDHNIKEPSIEYSINEKILNELNEYVIKTNKIIKKNEIKSNSKIDEYEESDFNFECNIFKEIYHVLFNCCKNIKKKFN